MREVITDFVDNCKSEQVKLWHKVHGFDESFWETTHECEDTWEDTDSEDMKRSLIDNYLLQFGYHTIEEDYENELRKEELINEYFKTNSYGNMEHTTSVSSDKHEVQR